MEHGQIGTFRKPSVFSLARPGCFRGCVRFTRSQLSCDTMPEPNPVYRLRLGLKTTLRPVCRARNRPSVLCCWGVTVPGIRNVISVAV